MEVDRHVELGADLPQGLITRMVVGRMRSPHDRDHDRAQPVLLRPAHLRNGLVDVVEGEHDRDAAAPLGGHLAELGEPAVVGPGPGPLERRVDAARGQTESRAEGWGVHLRDAVRKDHLSGDAIAVEHLEPGIVIPGAGQLVRPPAAPLLVDLLDEEHLLGLTGARDLDRQRLIERFPKLGIQIRAIALGRQPGVTVGRDEQHAVGHEETTREERRVCNIQTRDRAGAARAGPRLIASRAPSSRRRGGRTHRDPCRGSRPIGSRS